MLFSTQLPTFISHQPLPKSTIKTPTNPLWKSKTVCSTQPSYPQPAKTPTTAPSLKSLEKDYKEKKAAYKSAKALYKAAKKATEDCKEQKGEEMKKKQTKENCITTTSSTNTISVCSGSSCIRQGADAIAAMLTPGTPPNAKCMKMCGGVGPTICVDGEVVKVDLRAAVKNAVSVAQEKQESVVMGKTM